MTPEKIQKKKIGERFQRETETIRNSREVVRKELEKNVELRDQPKTIPGSIGRDICGRS